MRHGPGRLPRVALGAHVRRGPARRLRPHRRGRRPPELDAPGRGDRSRSLPADRRRLPVEPARGPPLGPARPRRDLGSRSRTRDLQRCALLPPGDRRARRELAVPRRARHGPGVIAAEAQRRLPARRHPADLPHLGGVRGLRLLGHVGRPVRRPELPVVGPAAAPDPRNAGVPDPRRPDAGQGGRGRRRRLPGARCGAVRAVRRRRGAPHPRHAPHLREPLASCARRSRRIVRRPGNRRRRLVARASGSPACLARAVRGGPGRAQRAARRLDAARRERRGAPAAGRRRARCRRGRPPAGRRDRAAHGGDAPRGRRRSSSVASRSGRRPSRRA